MLDGHSTEDMRQDAGDYDGRQGTKRLSSYAFVDVQYTCTMLVKVQMHLWHWWRTVASSSDLSFGWLKEYIQYLICCQKKKTE